MTDLVFKFILIYFRDIMLYSSLILGILLLVFIFFINKYKEFLLNRINFLFNNDFVLLLILLLLTFFLLLLLLFCVFSFILYWFYLIYYNIREYSSFIDLINLFVIYDTFNEINIKIIYIVFILNYIISLIWFYYIFIYEYENKNKFIFIYIYNLLFFILCLIICIFFYFYNINIAEAMIETNTKNSIFRFNIQDYKNFNIIPLNMLENKNLLTEAIKFKGQILTDNKELVFCYNNKNDLYNSSIIKSLNFYKSTSTVTFIEYNSEYINTADCKCLGLKINYNVI